MANRLAGESSPYLRQHQHNPVEWYPWGEEALGRARAEDRPLLVSIGYSACHWCHVMERESFEDEAIAALMNERFVCIKVDREERPDVDAVCMEACQALTGQGGWPLNAFLTPEQQPFYAGTYFPPEPRHGMPSWRMVLEAVAQAWDQRRDRVREQGAQMLGALGGASRLTGSEDAITPEVLEEAVTGLRGLYDSVNGGFGTAPKFPQASLIEFLLAPGEIEMALSTLRAMARGGIYDQVGGGFARYAVDATWTVPHFEKMLYDNALLARAYLHGWQVSGDGLLRRTCEESLDWALREMRDASGGFYCALDADSEGVEGRYYVWSLDELRAVLGELAEPALAFFGATASGNFEGVNVLEGRGPEPEALPQIRSRLYAARERRVRPGCDDKQLTSWNALMISALAEAGAVLGREDYLAAAVAGGEFVLARRCGGDDGRLLRTDRIDAYLDDYAYLVEALLVLYEATHQTRWFIQARALADAMIERFGDESDGGFFTTAAEHGGFARRKDLDDSPIPAGGSSAAFGLLRLAAFTGEYEYERRAREVLRVLAPIIGRHPHGFGHALQALDFHLAEIKEVAIVGEDAGALVRAVHGAYRPHVVLAAGEADGVPLLEGRGPVDGQAAAYVCEHFSCRAPVTSADELTAALG